ncbi:hypothetical protein [Nocardioides pocheonensis]|uniref:Uncharacterized protein n=1 Tax=Nocardioides pocheonensis TaxID=661485 RepID=A0A3N0GP94_9ACTN|nr:hypothetical protein [Nocardioides pocheonensis]RNM14247.1 hypothetical protein EFL26_15110 [Nocardioides pocheonensis]
MRPLFADTIATARADELPDWPQAPAAPAPASPTGPATGPAVPTQRRPADRVRAPHTFEAQRLRRTAG